MHNDNLDVQQLMHEIRAGVANQQRPAAESQSLPTGAANGNLKPAGHYHVNELLRFHGEDFVRNAYLVLLGREPDEAGLAHHLDQLASGRFNKIDVLASLHSSREGSGAGVKLTGLSLPFAVRRTGRIPVIGYIVRLMVAITRLPVLIQHQNQYEFYNWSQQKRIIAHQDRHHKELSETLQQISAQILEITQRAAEQVQANELSLRQYADLMVKHHEFASAIEARLAGSDESSQNLSEQIASQAQQLLHHKYILEQLQQIAVQQKAETQQLLGSLTEQQQQQQQLSSKIRAELQPLMLRQQKAEVELLMQERRLTVLLEQITHNSATANTSVAEVAAAEEDHLLDALYASFEDEFRGTREEVSRRLQVYIPILKEAGITGSVLDIGCGRGEWLQLLETEAIKAQGLDRNRVFIEQCRAAGLDVVENDALIHLRNLPAESLSAVTIFHLVEHLPLETLIKVVDEIVRTLKHGGLLIVETPNPENFVVGSYTFYADPTHRNPIPSQTLQFLIEARGLRSLDVLKLRSRDEVKLEGDSELVTRFNEYFYCAPDYAIIARKP
jgi:O-antigen chain-terminating methyltransferase